jgi:hypothetical protein
VPCAARVSSLESNYAVETSIKLTSEEGKEDEWLEPQCGGWLTFTNSSGALAL